MTDPGIDAFLQQRNRRLTSGILTSVVSRGIAAVVPLVMVPLTLSYLGTQLYGLWMAVAALTGMAAFADLGLGNGLMTKLAPCYASGETSTARSYISNAYVMVASLAVTIVIALWALSGSIPWVSLFNVDDSAVALHATGIATICLSAFLLNVPLSLVYRVQYAYQRVGQANIWQATGSLWSIALVIGAVQLQLSPELVVMAAVIGPPLSNMLNSLWLFRRQLPEIAPRLQHVDRDRANLLLSLGGRFLLLTVVMSLAMNADNLVIANVLGLGSVTTFSVPARLFAQLGLLVSLVNLPLWPANGEALARGDVDWVRRITARMTLASALAVAAPGLVLVLAGDRLLSAWLGLDIGASQLLMAGLAAWWVMLAAISPRFMVQNSAGVVMPQLLGWSLYLLLSVPLKLWAAASFGVDAVPLVGVVVYAFVVLPAAIWGYRRAMSEAIRTRAMRATA
jgi:O-antigen/teichoic acid export membrane protein